MKYRLILKTNGKKRLVSDQLFRTITLSGTNQAFTNSPSVLPIDPSQDFTFSVWIYRLGGSGIGYFITRLGTLLGISIGLNKSNGQARILIGATFKNMTSPAISANQWTMYTYVHQRAIDSGILYLNGTRATSSVISWTSYPTFDSGQYTQIGSTSSVYSGMLSQLALWDRQLSSGEISTLYQNPISDYQQDFGLYSGSRSLVSYLDQYLPHSIRDKKKVGAFYYWSGMNRSILHP